MNLQDGETRTPREPAVRAVNEMLDARRRSLDLLEKVPADVRRAGIDLLVYLIGLQQRFSRRLVLRSWVRPWLVRGSHLQPPAELPDGILLSYRPAITPTGMTLEEVRSLDEAVTRTLRQRLNCFEHEEWGRLTVKNRHLGRALTFLQWLQYFTRLEQELLATLNATGGDRWIR
ncbi:hypothetical protein JW905_05810 [bacterium]|nr:hypothetical protein [candidate division CSSED10-310 bacterium]